MQKIRRKEMLLVRVLKNRWVAFGALIAVIAVVFALTTINTHAVWIIDGDKKSYVVTTSKNVDEILSSKGVVTKEEDKVNFTGFYSDNAEITITRAFPVIISADGVDHAVMVTDANVSDLLAMTGISLNEQDTISHDLDYSVSEGDKIIVTRMDTHTYITTETVEAVMEKKYTPLLKSGRTRVVKAGTDGEIKRVYAETFVDGKSTGVELISEEVITPVENGEVLVGDKVAASPLEPETPIELDKNGNPVNYTKVYTNQIATAYSAKSGAKGASGLPAKTGYVAVRASMIPYGSELYIKTPDGSFVYGYCIAGDTGTGLLQNIIDVDVFFDTYLESCLFGRKTVDIYVLN